MLSTIKTTEFSQGEAHYNSLVAENINLIQGDKGQQPKMGGTEKLIGLPNIHQISSPGSNYLDAFSFRKN